MNDYTLTKPLFGYEYLGMKFVNVDCKCYQLLQG